MASVDGRPSALRDGPMNGAAEGQDGNGSEGEGDHGDGTSDGDKNADEQNRDEGSDESEYKDEFEDDYLSFPSKSKLFFESRFWFF